MRVNSSLLISNVSNITEQVPGTMARHLQFDMSVLACVASLYLAYILAFVLRDLCIICLSTYVINVYLLYESHGRLFSDVL